MYFLQFCAVINYKKKLLHFWFCNTDWWSLLRCGDWFSTRPPCSFLQAACHSSVLCTGNVKHCDDVTTTFTRLYFSLQRCLVHTSWIKLFFLATEEYIYITFLSRVLFLCRTPTRNLLYWLELLSDFTIYLSKLISNIKMFYSGGNTQWWDLLMLAEDKICPLNVYVLQ